MQKLTLITRTLGLLSGIFGASLLIPTLISLLNRDGLLLPFFLLMISTLGLGLVMGWMFRGVPFTPRTHDGFIIVGLFWVVLSLMSALPFVAVLDISTAAAVFEAVSGFTTTGATVLSGLDDLPPSLLYYRMQLHWFGGIGVIVTAVALLPMLGIGGMQLVRAEVSGPMKEEKIAPRIAETARVLWKVYGMLTIACALAYWFAGMDAFDALTHSFSTVSTGGFSTHDASMGYFDSPLIEAIAIFFMLLGAINFALHFTAWRTTSVLGYLQSTEVRVFLAIITGLILVVALVLFFEGAHSDPGEALRYAAFEVVSVITSTGFGIADFSLWPSLLPVLLIFASFIGGCAGSTAGGMKVIRYIVLFKQALKELTLLVHPNAIRPIKLQNRVVPVRVVQAVWGFFAAYVFIFVGFMVAMMALGLHPVTAFGAVAACLNNLGPGLGEVSSTFATVPEPGLWLMSLAMLLGRLEIFTLLVLLSPAFWRR